VEKVVIEEVEYHIRFWSSNMPNANSLGLVLVCHSPEERLFAPDFFKAFMVDLHKMEATKPAHQSFVPSIMSTMCELYSKFVLIFLL
jgi:hypothetical protein